MPPQKKTHKKKKEIIIEEQNKKRMIQRMEEDNKLVQYMIENKTERDLYLNLKRLSTDEGRILYKCKLLKIFWKEMKNKINKNAGHTFNLYYDLIQYEDKIPDEYLKTLHKIKKTLKKYDTKSYMLEHLGHVMPPLNHWDTKKFQLDDWQKQVIQLIKGNKSVIIKAPTSSGKTLIATAVGIIHKKILYICPAKPVAYQVGANFIKMGYKVHFMVENHDNQSYDSRTNIFVGTPESLENGLPKIYSNIEFNYIVYDEIHNLNDYESGKAYENIINIVNAPFLALSATIGNINKLIDYLQDKTKREIEYISYEKRFMNQQRWIFGNKGLSKLHPCSCYNIEDKESFNNISFTPNDCYQLYESLEEEFEDEIDDLEPDIYFKQEKMITLDEVRDYEKELKNKIYKLSETHRDTIEKVMNIYKDKKTNPKVLESLVPLLFNCKDKDLLPLLYFHTEETHAKKIFYYLFNTLDLEEKRNYPFHYYLLEKKNEEYLESKKRQEIYRDSIKIKTKDAYTEIQSKMEIFIKNEKERYIQKIIQNYHNCIEKCEENQIKKKNLQKEMYQFMKNPDFREQDIYIKHHEYCFTRGEPMSGDEIKEIRKEIKKSSGYLIDYENPIFQLLKRGIGLYIKSMPDAYNWILQRLMSQNKLGIVISDRTLCLGIDLPIRSVALSGYLHPKYSTSDYLQMSGRAGRRGHDNQGNIIFHGIQNYNELMKGEFPYLKGSDKKIYDSYSVIHELNKNISIENLNQYSLNGNSIQKKDMKHYPKKYKKLLWSLRYYDNTEKWIHFLDTIEKELFLESRDEQEYYLLRKIYHLFTDENLEIIYKRNRIDEKKEETIQYFKKVGEITRNIYNILDNTNYLITKKLCMIIFHKCKILIYKYELDN